MQFQCPYSVHATCVSLDKESLTPIQRRKSWELASVLHLRCSSDIGGPGSCETGQVPLALAERYTALPIDLKGKSFDPIAWKITVIPVTTKAAHQMMDSVVCHDFT